MARGASPTPLEHDRISSLPYTRTTSRTTRTTPRNTRITSRTIRTKQISSPLGGLLIYIVLNKGVAPPSDYPESSWKLQTACFGSLGELQTPSFFLKTRLDELYLVIGGLGGQKQEINPKKSKKSVYVNLKKYSI